MDSLDVRRLQEHVENYFAGYRVKRASNHLDRIVIGETTALINYKTFLGFKVSKKYEVTPIEIDFDVHLSFTRSYFNINHGIVKEKFSIECAVDESSKKVYWKAEISERTLQYK